MTLRERHVFYPKALLHVAFSQGQSVDDMQIALDELLNKGWVIKCSLHHDCLILPRGA